MAASQRGGAGQFRGARAVGLAAQRLLLAVGSPLPLELADWLFFATQVASVVLVGLFALAVAGRFDSRWRSVWLVGGAVMAALGAAAAAGHWLQQARALLYPVLLLGLLVALTLVWRTCGGCRGRRSCC